MNRNYEHANEGNEWKALSNKFDSQAKNLTQFVTRRVLWHLSIALAALASLSTLNADEVTDWNVTTENDSKTVGIKPGMQGRLLAIVHTAVYDAVNGIVSEYTPYFVTESAPPGARAEAAAVQAAYTTLKALFPGQTATFDAQLADSLANI